MPPIFFDYGIFFVNASHVAADGISFAATFCKSHLSLILSRLLSESNPLTLGFDSVFYYSTGYLFTNISHAGAKSALLRRIFISTIKNTSCVAPLLLLSETHPSDVSRGPFQASYRLRRRFFFQNNRHRALTPLLLLSKSNPLTLGFNFVFILPGHLSCQSLPRHCGRHVVRS